ncbi:MAG: hypothetical protein ABI873_08385 [Marmoricola sp.]
MTTSTSWTAFHHRGEVLRTVTDEADLRRDGTLPMHLSGVAETFHDELDLIGSLQMRWQTRLAGTIERQLAGQPLDLEAAVQSAWAATAEELPGIRAIIDRHAESPSTPGMERALGRAATKERVLLATMAGRASRADERAEAVGRDIQEAARASYQPPPRAVPSGSAAFVARIKAVLAA